MSGFMKTAERTDWLQGRKLGIGASEAAAVLGVDPWKSPFQLWSEKIGIVDQDDLSENEAVEFGIRLEQPVAMAYADRTGRNVAMWPPYCIARHSQIDWMCCTPDATQIDEIRGEGLVQVKTTSAWKQHEWAEGPPLAYLVQCQHELAVTGHDWTTLVVLIGGQRLRFFDINRNEQFIAGLIPKLEEFWNLIQTRTPPEVDGSLATAKVLAKLHPEDSGDTVALPQDAREWAATLEAAKQTIKDMEAVKTEAENKLKAAIGSATFGMLPDGARYSWKTQTRKSYVVEENTFRVLRKLK